MNGRHFISSTGSHRYREELSSLYRIQRKSIEKGVGTVKCDYCNNEVNAGELGKFKDKRVCYNCATNKSIPADFEEFLGDIPHGEESEAEKTGTGEKKKEDGSTIITFAISVVIAGSAGLYWLQQVHHTMSRLSYVFLIEGILTGLFCRVLQKGRGGKYQNIAAVMVMASYFFPQMVMMNSNPDMAQTEGMSLFLMNILKDFAWLIGGVFSTYFLLLPIKPKKKKSE